MYTSRKNVWSSDRRGFLILWEFLFSLLFLYLLLCVCQMNQNSLRRNRKIRQRIFASYFAEGITIESLSAKGTGLQSENDAVPSHISSLGSLGIDFQRISFGRSLLPDIDIMRYTTSCPPGDIVDAYHGDAVSSDGCDIVNTSVTWYESGSERTVIVSATL